MAKKGPRSYPNTFWMILGTSTISLILGPIIGHFWARGPRIYGFSYTKIAMAPSGTCEYSPSMVWNSAWNGCLICQGAKTLVT